MVHKYNGISLNQKKNEILPLVATWMNLENITLSEDRYRNTNMMISLLCGI